MKNVHHHLITQVQIIAYLYIRFIRRDANVIQLLKLHKIDIQCKVFYRH